MLELMAMLLAKFDDEKVFRKNTWKMSCSMFGRVRMNCQLGIDRAEQCRTAFRYIRLSHNDACSSTETIKLLYPVFNDLSCVLTFYLPPIHLIIMVNRSCETSRPSFRECCYQNTSMILMNLRSTLRAQCTRHQ